MMRTAVQNQTSTTSTKTESKVAFGSKVDTEEPAPDDEGTDALPEAEREDLPEPDDMDETAAEKRTRFRKYKPRLTTEQEPA